MDMLIHKSTKLPYKGVDLTEKFVGKTKETKFIERMKTKFRLVKGKCGYSIRSIIDQVVQFAVHILIEKVMRKCCADEMPTPVISLVAQCMDEVEYNQAQYLCREF